MFFTYSFNKNFTIRRSCYFSKETSKCQNWENFFFIIVRYVYTCYKINKNDKCAHGTLTLIKYLLLCNMQPLIRFIRSLLEWKNLHEN